MKVKKKIAWMLSILMAFSVLIGNADLDVWANGGGATFTINITDTTSETANKVFYRFNDSDSWTQASNGTLIVIESQNGISVKVERANGVNLDFSGSTGFDTNDFMGTTGENGNGQRFVLNVGQSYALNVKFSAGGGTPPQGDAGVSISINNGENGMVSYKIGNGNWQEIAASPYSLRPGFELNGVTTGTLIYLKAVPNQNQAFDTQAGQNNNRYDATDHAIDTAALQAGTYSFAYDTSKLYNVTISFEGSGGGPINPPPAAFPDNVTLNFGSLDMTKIGGIFLNGSNLRGMVSNGSCTGSGYGSANPRETNEIKIQPEWGYGIESITINGTSYNDKDGEMVVATVPAADRYDISVNFAASSDDVTITWAYDLAKFWGDNYNPADASQAEVLVEHGKVEVVSITRAGTTIYDATAPNNDVRIDSNGGWVAIKKGDDVVLKLTPDYGYQLKSVTINDKTLTPKENVSTFELKNIQGNLHFSGVFVKSADIVSTAKSDVVSTASIANGSNAAPSGNLRLTVADNAAYDTTAAEKLVTGAESAQAIDLTLDQVVSKGNGSNWENNITEFTNPITLNLDIDNYDSNYEYTVVRNHNGTLTELETSVSDGTLSFETNQFSTYVIVKKPKTASSSTQSNTNKTTQTGSPKTGDEEVPVVWMFAMVLSGGGFIYLSTKKRKLDK